MHEGFYGGENSFVVRLSVPKSPNLRLSTASSPELPSPYRSNGTTPQSRATAPSVSSPCCILPTSNLLTPSPHLTVKSPSPFLALPPSPPLPPLSDSVLMSPMSALILSHSGRIMCSLMLNGSAVPDVL